MSTSSEKALWRWITNDKVIQRLPVPVLHMHRIENTASSGMPDVEGIFNGVQFWLELKIAHRPVNEHTPIDLKHIRPKQVEFLHNRWLAKGKAWILLRVGHDVYLIPGKFAMQLRSSKLAEIDIFPLSKIARDASPLDILNAATAK